MLRLPILLAGGLIALAIAAIITATPLGWGGGAAADGTRFKVSAIAISHVLEPDQPVSPTRDCRWSPPGGDVELCAVLPGGGAAFRVLQLLPWVLRLAGALAIAGALLIVLRPRSRRRIAPATLELASLAALGAPALLAWAAPRALAALQQVDFGVGGTRGTLQLAAAAAVLAGIAAALAQLRVARAALLAVPALAFLAMFPMPGALAFAAASAALGLGAGHWLRRGAAPA